MNKYLSTSLAAVLLLLSACSSDSDTELQSGTVTITSVSKSAAQWQTVTRAVDEGLAVQVLNAQGVALYSYTADEAASLTSLESLSLPVMTYQLRGYSANVDSVYADDDLGEAKWDGRQSFSVVSGQNTRVGVDVPMVNMGVTVSYPDGMDTWFSSVAFTAKHGSRTLTIQPGETGYFDLDDSEDLIFTLSLTNTDGENQTLRTTRSASDLATGTVYEVSYEVTTESLVARQKF